MFGRLLAVSWLFIATTVQASTVQAVKFGGTGASTAAGARTNLQAAKSGSNSDITHLTGLESPLYVILGGLQSAGNTTTTTLGSNATFTGSWVDVLDYNNIQITVYSNVASATNGLVVQWSNDGSTVHATDSFTIPAASGKQYSFGRLSRYIRVNYTNGASAQSTFSITTILSRGITKPSSHKVSESISDDDDTELTKSVITVRKPDGSYAVAQGDDSGNLIVASSTSFGAAFFGDVASSSTTEKVVRRTTYTDQTTNAQRSFSSTDVDDDGSPADTGARTLKVTYLDSTGAGPYEETITLNGTTCVATAATDIAFVEKIEILTVGSTGATEGTVSMYVNASCGGGTIGTIGVGATQTYWGHHYVPAGKTANVTGISADSNATTVGCGSLFVLKTKSLSSSDAVERQEPVAVRLYGQSSTTFRGFSSPARVAGPARMLVYATPECSTSLTFRTLVDYYEE